MVSAIIERIGACLSPRKVAGAIGRFYELEPEGDTPSFILPRVKQRGRRQNSPPPFFDMGHQRSRRRSGEPKPRAKPRGNESARCVEEDDGRGCRELLGVRTSISS